MGEAGDGRAVVTTAAGAADAAGAEPARSNGRAIFAMVLSTFLYTLSDAAMKFVAAAVPTGEAVALRSAMAVALLAIAAAVAGVLGSIRQALVPPMAWRSIGDGTNSLFFQAALARMPLADAMGIMQLSPLALTAASALLLKARVGWRRWGAVLAGFAGALLVIKPGSGAFNAWGLLAVLSVAAGTMRDLATRRFEPGLSPLVILLVSQAGVGLLGACGLMFERWHLPTPIELGQLAIGATFIVGGHLALIAAVRHSDLATVAPFRYAGILWAILAGFLIWRDVPDAATLAGIAILIAAGLYTLHRERMVARHAVGT